MANGKTFKVRDKTTGEVFTIREKVLVKEEGLQPTPQRKDTFGEGVASIQKRLQQAPQQPLSQQVVGLGKKLLDPREQAKGFTTQEGILDALKLTGGGVQRLEAAQSNPILELIKSGGLAEASQLVAKGQTPVQAIAPQLPLIAEEAKKGLTGEKITERGDIFRALGVGEKTAATLGFISDPLILKSFFGTGSRSIAKESIKQADNVIDDVLPKILKQSPGKTGTATKAAKAAGKGRTAIKTITEMKGRLQLKTKEGEIVSKLPETLDEFSQAIDQTKKILFDEAIDPAVKSATKGGAVVNIDDTIKIMDDILKDPAIKFTNPDMIKYTEAAKKRLLETPNSPKVINDIITNLNQNLQAFYKAPVGDPAITKKLAVDSLIANKLRAALDDTVSNFTGKSLSVPKLKYGALRSIEESVRKQANKIAEKSVGIIDYSNIFSVPNLVSGFATANSGAIARGGTQLGLAQLAKFFLNPNRAVMKMFTKVEKLTALPPSLLNQLGIKAASTKAPASGLLLKELMKSR